MVSEAGPKVIAIDSRGRAVKNRVQAENMKKAGHHRHGDTLPFVLRDQVRLVRTWSPPLYGSLGAIAAYVRTGESLYTSGKV